MKVNDDGTFTFTAAKDYEGTVEFTYVASDGSLTSDPATVSIPVAAKAKPAPAPSDTPSDHGSATNETATATTKGDQPQLAQTGSNTLGIIIAATVMFALALSLFVVHAVIKRQRRSDHGAHLS